MLRFRIELALALLALVGAIALGTNSGFARAQDLPPRPDAPAATPTSDRNSGGGRQAATGVVTGTVINSTTGAPAPGVTVYVGGVAVVTDAYGNYVRGGLAGGRYSLWLGLEHPRVADQPLMTVEVAPGATLVQHLFFHEAR